MGHNATPKQNMAIDLLASGKTLIETSETVGVARSTLNRWLGDALFRVRLQEAETERSQKLRRALSNLDDLAAEVLKECLMSSDKRLKLRAVEIQLKNRIALDDRKFEERLEKIERDLSERG